MVSLVGKPRSNEYGVAPGDCALTDDAPDEPSADASVMAPMRALRHPMGYRRSIDHLPICRRGARPHFCAQPLQNRIWRLSPKPRAGTSRETPTETPKDP